MAQTLLSDMGYRRNIPMIGYIIIIIIIIS